MQEVSVYEWFLAQAENMRKIDESFKEGGQQATSILAINQIQYMKAMMDNLEKRYVSDDVRNRYNSTSPF